MAGWTWAHGRSYGLALLVVAAAGPLTELVRIATGRTVFGPFYLAVAAAGWYGGVGPGLLAVGLAALVTNYFFIPPLYQLGLGPAGLLLEAIFLLVALSISWLTGGRQRAEAFARQQYAQLRVTLASLGDGVLATDGEGRVTFLNPVAEELTGWSLPEAAGQPLETVFRIVNEESRQPVENPVRRALREGSMVGLANQTLLLARGGREIPIDDSAAPVRDETGEPQGVVLVFRDVAERRRAERLLRQQKEALQEQAQLLELAQDAIMVFEMASGAITFWNRGAEMIYGWSRAEALGQNPHDLLQTRFPQPLAEIEATLEREGYWQGELVHIRRDGASLTLNSRWALQRGEQGRPAKVLEITTDITELRRAEQTQRRLAEVGLALTSSLDYETTLKNMAQLVIPDLADWCEIYVREGEDQPARRLYAAHRDPARQELAEQFHRRYPIDWNAPTGVPQVLRAGQAELYPEVTDDMLKAGIQDKELRATFRQFQVKSLMIVPMVAHEKILGAMVFAWAESGRRYDRDDLALAEELARRAALAMDNARLYQAEQVARQRLAFLAEAGQIFSGSLDYEVTLARVLELAGPFLAEQISVYLLEVDGSVRRALVHHIDPAGAEIVRAIHEQFPLSPEQAHPVQTVIATGEPVLVPEITETFLAEMTGSAEHLALARQLAPKTLMIVPLAARGRMIGAVSFMDSRTGRRYGPADLELARELAYRAALAIDNARLHQGEQAARQASEQAARRTGRLQAVTAALSAALTPDEMAKVIVQEGLQALGAQRGFVTLLTPDGEALEMSHVTGYPDAVRDSFRQVPLAAPVPAVEVVQTGEPVWLETAEAALARYPALAEAQKTSDSQATVVAPLTVHGQVIGAVGWGFDAPQSFGEGDRAFILTLARQCAQAMDRARLYQAEQQARLEAQQEVTVRRQAEEKLQVALAEKEVLLREVNHRVKNNLQAISNLLYLQGNYLEDAEARRKFEETQNRVKSIAMIHEQLYQTGDFTRVDFGEYVEKLAGELIRTYRVNPEMVRLVVTGDGTAVGVETAVPLGIMINELVSNALKHAFPGERPGEIKIDLRAEDEEWLRLTVSDNGVGLPDGWELAESRSLGLQLVRMLAGYMRGEVIVVRREGMRVTVRLRPGEE